jgi:hypothetical protein
MDEDALGFTLPPPLKQVYQKVGNGGFGPGYGLIGMTGGAPDDTGKTAPYIYAQFRTVDTEEPEWIWRPSLLPICHWGCGILSCVACDEPDYPMYIFDPNAHDSDPTWQECIFHEASSFASWLTDWAKGVNLWDRTYGKSGFIRKALEERPASAE